MAGPPRAHWTILIGGAAGLAVAAFVVPAFVAAPDLEENRALADAPAPPRYAADLAAFRRGTDAWVADRFPPRALLIGGLNRLRMLAGISGSPRVLIGRHGWLFYDDGSHLGAARGDPALTDPEATAWLDGLAGRTEALAAQGRAYVVVAPPMKEAVYPDLAPGWMRLDPNRPAVTLARLAEASGAGRVIYPYGDMARQAGWGLLAFSPHDTHWTGLGAWYGYAALMRDLHARGLTEGPRPMEAFAEVRRGAENKPRNLALMLGVASFVDVDYPELADPDAEARIRTDYLTARHDWTAPRVIETGEVGKPTLLLLMDSYSSAFVPLLYTHFDRIVLAHNQDGYWREDLIARFQPDIVVTEVLESGLPGIMGGSPPPSPEAAARIRQAVAERARHAAKAGPPRRVGPPRRRDGGDGDDRIDGDDGPDTIQARGGDDIVRGLGGDDVLRGGRGNDVVDGGEGDDWVSGGRGDDTVSGGPGRDVFNSFEGAGLDVVTDYSAAEGDRVELDPGTAYEVRQEGPDTVVVMRGARLVLKNVKAADLPRGWIRNW